MSKKLAVAIVFLFFLGVYPLMSQEIVVYNSTSLKPVENVFIYNLNRSHSTLTNSSGEAYIEGFQETDTLMFQHPSFENVKIAVYELANEQYIVMLKEVRVNLQPFSIIATKRSQGSYVVSNEIRQLQAKDVEFLNPQTSGDLVNNIEGVYLQKSQQGGGSPILRGFAANSILLVFDNVRMNNAIYRSGNLQNIISVDPAVVDRVEVLFGPGSVIYGSDALGGVINFKTIEPELIVNEKMHGKVNSSFRYSTANNEINLHVNAHYANNKWASYTSATFSEFGELSSGQNFYKDYPDFGKNLNYVQSSSYPLFKDSMLVNPSPNHQINSDYNQINLMQKILFQPKDHIKFKYTAYYSTTSDIPRYDRLTQYDSDSVLAYAVWKYGPQAWFFNNLVFENSLGNVFYEKVTIGVNYQNLSESRISRKFGDPILKTRAEGVNIVGLNVDFDKKLHKKNVLYYGLDFQYNHIGSEAYSQDVSDSLFYLHLPESTRYPDGGTNFFSSALYASLQTEIDEFNHINTGLRFSHVALFSKFIDKTFFPFDFDEISMTGASANGSLGFVHQKPQKYKFFTNISSGYRAPNLDDIAKVFDSEPGNVVVPNPDLKPEYAYTYDIGFLAYVGDKTQFQLSGFFTWLDEVMVRSDFQLNGADSILYDGVWSNVQAVTNSGSGIVTGANLEMKIEFNQFWFFKGAGSYSYGQDLSEDMPLRHIPPVFAHASLNYRSEKLHLRAYSNYNGWKRLDRLSQEELSKLYLYTVDGTPSWFTLNFNGVYEFEQNIHLSFGLENILDKHYRPYSSGISASGRSFFIGLRSTF